MSKQHDAIVEPKPHPSGDAIDSASHQPPFRWRKRRRGVAAGGANEALPWGLVAYFGLQSSARPEQPFNALIWLGRQDSNLGMAESKSTNFY
jgi:hypothetical protein